MQCLRRRTLVAQNLHWARSGASRSGMMLVDQTWTLSLRTREIRVAGQIQLCSTNHRLVSLMDSVKAMFPRQYRVAWILVEGRKWEHRMYLTVGPLVKI